GCRIPRNTITAWTGPDGDRGCRWKRRGRRAQRMGPSLQERRRTMESNRKNARVAGLLYLSLLTAPLPLIYIPGKLFVSGNPSATARNIAAHETLFRLGIASDLLTGTMGIFVALALYRLFKGVDRDLARLLVILGCFMVTPIYFVNTLNDVAALL